jgi:hypothetical protein
MMVERASREMSMIGRARSAGWARAVSASGPLLAWACGDHATLEDPQRAEPSAWFSPCADDPDCQAPAACVNGRCTLACDVSSLELCASLDADAVCDTDVGACEVPCGVDMACQALGAGFACVEERCRANVEAR